MIVPFRLLLPATIALGVAQISCRHAEPVAKPGRARSCFLLYEIGVGPTRRSDDGDVCTRRLTPASTFKIPHALFALDAGVVQGPDDRLPYDGSPYRFAVYRRDHTLASALRHSVVWYFQRLAERLGPLREREYMTKIRYGNADPSSGLTSFWLYGSLTISPDEQQEFLLRLYQDALPFKREDQESVRKMLVQPQNAVVNAMGEHPFAAPWPPDTTVSAKTGSASKPDSDEIRWLVGHVRRGNRAWIFVACVSGDAHLSPTAAIDLAAASLRAANVL